MTQTTTADRNADDNHTDRSYLYREDGTLRSAAELAVVHEAKPKAAKSRKVKAVADVQTAKADAKAPDAQPVSVPAKKAKEARPTCTATKKDGTACTARCMEHAGTVQTYCTDHRPAHLHLTPAELASVRDFLFDAAGLAQGVDEAIERIVPDLVNLMGWGQVREAIKRGRL